MAIVNRTLDGSEQKRTFTCTVSSGAGGILNGSTLHAVLVPFAGSISAVSVAATGLSGSPMLTPKIQRFIVGTGVTTIGGWGATIPLPEWGTSGTIACSLTTAGSTLLNVLPFDVISFTTIGGTGAAFEEFAAAIVIQASQEIKTQLGV